MKFEMQILRFYLVGQTNYFRLIKTRIFTQSLWDKSCKLLEILYHLLLHSLHDDNLVIIKYVQCRVLLNGDRFKGLREIVLVAMTLNGERYRELRGMLQSEVSQNDERYYCDTISSRVH